MVIMGKTKRDRIRNEHITEELKMEDIQNQIQGNSLRQSGHVKGMDEHRIHEQNRTERVLDMKMSGKRPRGRP
jgi:hypothetical protein